MILRAGPACASCGRAIKVGDSLVHLCTGEIAEDGSLICDVVHKECVAENDSVVSPVAKSDGLVGRVVKKVTRRK